MGLIKPARKLGYEPGMDDVLLHSEIGKSSVFSWISQQGGWRDNSDKNLPLFGVILILACLTQGSLGSTEYQARFPLNVLHIYISQRVLQANHKQTAGAAVYLCYAAHLEECESSPLELLCALWRFNEAGEAGLPDLQDKKRSRDSLWRTNKAAVKKKKKKSPAANINRQLKAALTFHSSRLPAFSWSSLAAPPAAVSPLSGSWSLPAWWKRGQTEKTHGAEGHTAQTASGEYWGESEEFRAISSEERYIYV